MLTPIVTPDRVVGYQVGYPRHIPLYVMDSDLTREARLGLNLSITPMVFTITTLYSLLCLLSLRKTILHNITLNQNVETCFPSFGCNECMFTI